MNLHIMREYLGKYLIWNIMNQMSGNLCGLNKKNMLMTVYGENGKINN